MTDRQREELKGHEARVLAFAIEAERLGLAVEIGETVLSRSGFQTEIARDVDVTIDVIGGTAFVSSGRILAAAARTREPANLEATIARKRRDAAKAIVAERERVERRIAAGRAS